MMNFKSLLGLTALVLLLGSAAPVLIPGQSQDQAFAEAGDWKNVTILYTTDIKGKIEPCG